MRFSFSYLEQTICPQGSKHTSSSTNQTQRDREEQLDHEKPLRNPHGHVTYIPTYLEHDPTSIIAVGHELYDKMFMERARAHIMYALKPFF